VTNARGERARHWLRPPLVCLVTDDRRAPADLLERVLAAVSGGVTVVQLREKRLPAGELLALARALRERLAGRAALLVNDRLDVALAADADGVHLPAGGLPPDAARRLAPHLLIGRSVHAADEAAAAQLAGSAGPRVAGDPPARSRVQPPSGADAGTLAVDYLLLGTIFASGSHPDIVPVGLPLLQATRPRFALPLLAIGGITPENAASAVEAGADGVAAIGALLASDDPCRAAQRLVAAVHTGWEARRAARTLVGAG